MEIPFLLLSVEEEGMAKNDMQVMYTLWWKNARKTSWLMPQLINYLLTKSGIKLAVTKLITQSDVLLCDKPELTNLLNSCTATFQ